MSWLPTQGFTVTISADFLLAWRHGALVYTKGAGLVADTAAVHGHVRNLLLHAGFVGPVYMVGLKDAPTILALEAGTTALGSVANYSLLLQYLQGTS